MISFKNIINNIAEDELLTAFGAIVTGAVLTIIIAILVKFVLWEPFSYAFGRFAFIVFVLVLILGHLNYRINKEQL